MAISMGGATTRLSVLCGDSVGTESLGWFSVQEHNKNEDSLLEFGRVVKAKQQEVSGVMYHLTLETVDNDKKKLYKAKVWMETGMNFKQLKEFKACV